MGTSLERAESLVFVKDGFSWGAFAFGPLYFLARAEWLSLAAYVLAAVVLSAVMSLLGATEDWIGWVLTLLNVNAGFEASEMKRWSLARAGWQEIATVTAPRGDEAERRFFEAWLPTVPAETPAHERSDPTHRDPPWYGDAKEQAGAMIHRLSASLRSKLVPRI
jgi:hypothetical protein